MMMMNRLMMATGQRSCYSVWVRITMRRMTTITAQTTPIMIIFYREGDTEREKGESSVNVGKREH